MTTTLATARADFLRSLGGRSPATRHTYGTALKSFLEFLGGETGEVGRLGDDVLEAYHLWLVGSDYGAATTATYTAGVRAFLRHCARRRWLAPTTRLEDVIGNLGAVKHRASYRAPRSKRQAVLLIERCDALAAARPLDPETLRDRALLRVLFATGLRREELVGLDRDDIEGTEARIVGKGGRERVVFFDRPALDAVAAYLALRNDKHRPLFLRHDGGRADPGPRGEHWRITASTVYRVIQRAAAAVGIAVTPHDFRHLKASTLLQKGADLSEVQDILGHASPETTKRIYAHYETHQLREVFDAYSATSEELLEAVR